MALSNEQVLELLRNPKQTVNIKKTINHENRLKFHCDIAVCKDDVSPYYTDYLDWVKSFLKDKTKQTQFEKHLTTPIKTNEVCDAIQDEYLKVFEAQDSFKDIQFSDEKFFEDFKEYEKTLKIKDFFHKEVFECMMYEIGSFIVVDMPVMEQSDNNIPTPYFYKVESDDIIDFSKEEDKVLYFIFKDCDRFIYIDEISYKIFIKEKDKFYFVSEVFHSLGYCPVKKIWEDDISPISQLLSHLDWYLFSVIAKGNLDLSSSYPWTWGYEGEPCQFEDQYQNRCENGFVYNKSKLNKGSYYECPICKTNKSIGWGVHLDVPPPRDGNALTIPPAGVIQVDVPSLEFNSKSCEDQRNFILASATGKNKISNNQAVNQSQIESQTETQTNVLNWIARNFEQTEKWLIDTICRLRYSNFYIDSSVSYGTTFYLINISEAIKDFNDAKIAGLPSYLLIQKLNIIDYLQSKNNYIDANRINIMKSLEPYTLLSLKECKDLGINETDKESFVLKANFYNFVDEFEYTFGKLENFGSKLPFKTKIEKIKAELNLMVQNKLKTKENANT